MTFANLFAVRGVNSRRLAAFLFALPILGWLFVCEAATACPFCTALKPTLTQQRDQANVAVLAEIEPAQEGRHSFRLLQTLSGSDLLKSKDSLELPSKSFDESLAAAKTGSLVMLLARRQAGQAEGELRWIEIPLNETSFAYIARAPSLRQPARKRLPYFLPFLEHLDPLLAEDAYLEFGHARFDEVAELADRLPQASFRKWLLDERVPEERKGFYGMALGLAPEGKLRGENAEFLRKLIERPSSDFRAGFDGLLGGYLLAGGKEALKLIDRKYLADPEAPAGDVRHAMTALRFYHEYGRTIPPQQLAQALAHVLVRRQFAAAAVVDLARWQAWEQTEDVARLGRSQEMEDRPTRRSVISFMLLSPTPLARREATRLRGLYPEEAAMAEQQLNLGGNAK
jgi:hypothetical protein